MKKRKLFLLLAALTSCSVAADNLTLKGALVEPPPCYVNGNVMIMVNFGPRVGVNKVDGINYRQKMPYLITCEQSVNPWEMTLKLTGEATSYDKAALQTNIDNLGIRVFVDDKPFELDKAVPMKLASLPVLEAVPVKKPGSTLKEGAFQVTATLQADYQ